MSPARIALLAGAAVLLAAAPARAGAPAIEEPVNDYGNLLTGPEKRIIEDKLVEERTQTGVQIAVLLVNTTGGQPIDDYALAVFDAWGGGSSERNDGVLLVLAIKDRRMRIEVGYDLEDRLTDGRARQILEEMKGGLRSGDYAGAISGAVDNIRRVTSGLEPVVTYRPQRTSGSGSSKSVCTGCQLGSVITFIIIALVVIFIVAFGGTGSSGGSSSGWSSGSSWSSWGSSSSSSSWSSSSSSSSSSVSWGGGGGSSGGGGASASW